jgi:predicted XRE-type DNA-binding protein
MKKLKVVAVIDGVEILASSGNVFADLELPNPETLKIKSGLVAQIAQAIQQLGITQEEAGKRIGLPQARVSRL